MKLGVERCMTTTSGASIRTGGARRGARGSSGKISERNGLPIASEADQPKSRSAAAFHELMRHRGRSPTKASGALSSTSRVRASLS